MLERFRRTVQRAREALPGTEEDPLRAIQRAASERSVTLDLAGRGFSQLPEEIGQLTNLQSLDLGSNQLTTLPPVIVQLTNLRSLNLHGNQLTVLPEAISQLTNLNGLFLSVNQLTTLPQAIGQLTNLQSLDLGRNRLATLPSSLARLQGLRLGDNPLDPSVLSASASGPDALRSYLGSLEEPDQREELYEAKLVFVGEGGVGKTTLLKAMAGREGDEPKEGEPTTHGVNIDIESLHLPHPDVEGVDIRLNAWDFGGQEVYRGTTSSSSAAAPSICWYGSPGWACSSPRWRTG